ncbi:MAG: hypothetical protein QXT73_06775 [Candidatus Methanomethylicaceae archaeon]
MKNKHFIFRVPEPLKEEVRAEAKGLGMTMTDFITCACELLMLVIKEIEVSHKFQLKALIAKMKEEITKSK